GARRPLVRHPAAARGRAASLSSARRLAGDHRSEHPPEPGPQRLVGLVHRRRHAEVDQTGDAVLLDAAGHDAAEMRQVRLDVQRYAVETDPAAHLDADGGDLVLARPARTLA